MRTTSCQQMFLGFLHSQYSVPIYIHVSHLSGYISITFHFLLLAVINALLVLWKQDFVMNTIILASILAIVLLIPHILMFLWLCYSFEKKFHLERRSVVCSHRLMGNLKFGKQLDGVQNSITPKWLSEFLAMANCL